MQSRERRRLHTRADHSTHRKEQRTHHRDETQHRMDGKKESLSRKKIKHRTQSDIRMCYYDSMERRDEGQRLLPDRLQMLLLHRHLAQ